jgi:hypothetical protein
MVVRPFGYREAAEFWGVGHEPELAFRLHALVGGTPAYKEMCGGSGPETLAGFDRWVQRRLLSPASAMFREGGLLLREEPSITDPTSYASVLAAISAGSHRRSEIAAALGRPSGALAHLLDGLRDIGLIEHLDDALRGKRTVFQITEPIVRLHQLITGRYEPELVAGRAARVWARTAETVASRIYGPHFEDVARRWCLEHAGDATLGGPPGSVRPTEVPCPEHRDRHQLDIVVADDPAGAASLRSERPRRRARRWASGNCAAWSTCAGCCRPHGSARRPSCSCSACRVCPRNSPPTRPDARTWSSSTSSACTRDRDGELTSPWQRLVEHVTLQFSHRPGGRCR